MIYSPILFVALRNSILQEIGRPQATADDIPAVFLRHYPAYKKKQLNVSEFSSSFYPPNTQNRKHISRVFAKMTCFLLVLE